MKIVLKISENGRTATRRVTTSGLLNVDDVVRAYFSAAKELKLPQTVPGNEEDPDSLNDEVDGVDD